MVTFFISIAFLLLGYVLYGRLMERIMAPDDSATPAIRLRDGVDYVPMPASKVFMIQFLNIAGTGPIFGAIMGMWFGPWAYLWIVLGCVFAGAVHDYFSGMLSVRHDGCGFPELVKLYLGRWAHVAMLVFSVLLLMMVGVVFVYSPAIILHGFGGNELMWVGIIFIYYIIATLLPIDKVIGKIYPFFAASLLFMALALMVVLVIKQPHLPELWDAPDTSQWTGALKVAGKDALGIAQYVHDNPLFPALFITIACGAISGFHATQSPLMARSIKSERLGRAVFYGGMITEGVVALIWATVSSYFFYYGGWKDVVGSEEVQKFMAQAAGPDGRTPIEYYSAPAVVKLVCTSWLGIAGGILAILGVVAAPITSGDTAFRSVRLIIADTLHLNQKNVPHRLIISVPVFLVAAAMLWWQTGNPDGFNVVWQYFGWSNQTLSAFVLWTITVYLAMKGKPYVVTLVPALFMSGVCAAFIAVSPQALGLEASVGYVVAACTVCCTAALFFWWKNSKCTTSRLK